MRSRSGRPKEWDKELFLAAGKEVEGVGGIQDEAQEGPGSTERFSGEESQRKHDLAAATRGCCDCTGLFSGFPQIPEARAGKDSKSVIVRPLQSLCF